VENTDVPAEMLLSYTYSGTVRQANRSLLKWGFRRGRVLLRHQSEGPRPPVWSKIEASQYAPLVTGYQPDGFTIGGNILRGSVALIPRGFFGWKVNSQMAIHECLGVYSAA